MKSSLPLFALAVALALPSIAAAEILDPEAPAADPAPADPGGPYAGPSSVTPQPAAPSAVADPCAIDEADPCGHGHFHHRFRGTLAIGLAKSHLELADDTKGTQASLVGRLTGRRGFGLELELGRARIDDDVAKTGSLSLVKQFGHRHLQPYVIAGGGRGTLDRADGSDARIRFAEAGGGLLVKKRRFALGLDLRRGVRSVDAGDPMTTARMVTPGHDDREHYTRARILALVTF